MAVTQSPTDEELMQAYRAGEISAFDELYARYSGRVYSYLESRVFNKNERDDLFQAIFLKLHKSRHLYLPRFPFAPWLFTICRTSLLDYVKSRKTTSAHERISEEGLISESNPESALALSQSLSQLSEQQKTALKLRYQEGLEFSEIASRLRTSSQNVRQVISRALRKLRGQS